MTQGKTHREPLLRIAKRDGIARPKAWAIRIIAVLLSLVVSGIFIFAVTKLNPFQVYEGIFDGAFGTPRRSWVTVRDAMMLLCIGVGLAPAFKMRFWNIGAEGQILIGGIVTAGFMRAFGGDISTPLLLVIMAVVSLLAGAAWGMVPATFKAVWNISGAICGLAGFIAVAGASHTISTSTAGGRGFTAIIVAWLAQFNTFVMILISFLLVFLQKGAIQIASQFNLNDYASNIITGIILFFILGSEFFINYRIILRGGKEGAK